QIDVDRNGLVSYQEFIPVCFQVLVERFKDEVVVSDILNNQDGLQGLLLRHFQAADSQGSGLLSQSSIKAILKELSFQVLGLTTLQMITLLSQAPTSPDGLVSYIQFVPMAAAMIYSMYDVDNMKLRLQAIKEASAAGGMRELSQLDIEGLRELLEGAFQTVDPQGNGQLSLPQVMEVLSSLGTLAPDHMQLTDLHMRAMFAAIDADESGTVDWFELVNFICDAIEHMEREAYIEQAEVRRLRDVEQSLMGTVDGLQGDLDDLQTTHQRLQQQQQLAAASTSRKREAPAANKSRVAKQGATHNSVAKRASAARLAWGEIT
ncbi:hypothetical protein QJQ45_022602, partial [Haematococcus lacustris]